MLLRAGAPSNEVSDTISGFQKGTKTTPLQKAAVMGDLEAMRLLVDYGASVNAPAYGLSGITVLRAALSQGDLKLTTFLLGKGADVNGPGNSDAEFPCSLVTTAVEMNCLNMVELILIPSFGYFGCTALESAMCLLHGSDLCDVLVARGAQHNTQPNHEYYQIQLRNAVSANDIDRFKMLLGSGLKIDTQPFSNGLLEQRSILQDAIQSERTVFQPLFDIIKTYDEELAFQPLLFQATLARNRGVQTTVLEAGANINSANSRAGNLIGTPLMFAVAEADLEIVQFLYEKGADIDVVTEGFLLDDYVRKASTTFQLSFWVPVKSDEGPNHAFEIFDFLRYHQAAINTPIARSGGRSELALAVLTEDVTVVRGLLDSGADINSLPADEYGRTALQAAASLDPANIDIVQLLM